MSEIRLRSVFVPSFQFLVYPNWISAKIQNCKNLCFPGCFAVVDSKGESFRKNAMQSKMLGMDAMKKAQTFDVR